ncbi:hypothetical protein EDB83DRAFT_2515334 [Lactarius deliciosus]|nr:hypothetical protein EDB83DRAFT_2515334 [Lactarius deliciosus]
MLSFALHQSSQPTDSLAKVYKLIQEHATSLALASRRPVPFVEQLLSHSTEFDTVQSRVMRCRFCKSADHLEEDCEVADKYIHTGMCRCDVVGKVVLPSGAQVPHNIKGGSLWDRLDEYYRPKAAQVSVSDIATHRQVTAPVTEDCRPVLPSHTKIAQEAIKPPDDYQTLQTTILSDLESHAVHVSVIDTISNPSESESSTSNSTNAPCGILPLVGDSCIIAISSGPSCVSPHVPFPSSASLSIPLGLPPSVSPSISILPSIPGPKQPHLRVTQVIESQPRWPQNHFIIPTSLHIVRQLERVWHTFPIYFWFPLPCIPKVDSTWDSTLPHAPLVKTDACEATCIPSSVSVASSTPSVLVSISPSISLSSGPEWPQQISQCNHKSATVAAMHPKVGPERPQ